MVPYNWSSIIYVKGKHRTGSQIFLHYKIQSTFLSLILYFLAPNYYGKIISIIIKSKSVAWSQWRSTRLLQLTGRWQYNGIMWSAILLMSTFLIRSASSQSSSYPFVLTSLVGPRSKPNSHLKLWKWRKSNPHDQ